MCTKLCIYGQHFQTLPISQKSCNFHNIQTRCICFKISQNLHNFATKIFLYPSFKVDESKLPLPTDPSLHSCCICIDVHKIHPSFTKHHINSSRVTQHTPNKPNFRLQAQSFTSQAKQPLESAHSIKFTALSGVGEHFISVRNMCIILI